MNWGQKSIIITPLPLYTYVMKSQNVKSSPEGIKLPFWEVTGVQSAELWILLQQSHWDRILCLFVSCIKSCLRLFLVSRKLCIAHRNYKILCLCHMITMDMHVRLRWRSEGLSQGTSYVYAMQLVYKSVASGQIHWVHTANHLCSNEPTQQSKFMNSFRLGRMNSVRRTAIGC